MKNLILALFFMSGATASAAQVNNVSLLDIKYSQDKYELKLGANFEGKDTMFFVQIPKSDPDSFEKLSYVIKKLAQGDGYKLNLDIRSFTASPSGSFYRSQDVKFSGAGDREPSSPKNERAKSLPKNKNRH
ncbi:hypothetical protein HW988_07855 [Bdellovibrio sp. KM01]|nr:hypothetical protein HW988_07855 [Bdellovibrio sp. KM01]